MDGDAMLGILCNMHMQVALTSPIKYNEFDITGIDKTKEYTSDQKSTLTSNAYDRYKENPSPLGRGSVDLAPQVWTEIVYKAVKESEGNTVKVPNGCCTKEDCPIALFYGLVIDEMKNSTIKID